MSDPIGDLLHGLNANRPHHHIRLPDSNLPLGLQPEATLLAMMAWGEARSEGSLGQLLVCLVARNRLRADRRMWWYSKHPRTWHSVLLHPEAFDCFKPSNPNYTKMLFPLRYDRRALPQTRNLIWETCCEMAYDVIEERVPDLTDGATLYRVIGTPASWARRPNVLRTVSYLRHEFFREEM